jgi:hypothetical protein
VAIEEHSALSVDYLVIINGKSRLLGELTALARRRANACYDGGSIGEVLRAHPELVAGAYGYYVLMNSSVRGPFLPRYYPRALPWTAALTGLLTDEVKLAGTTINCQGQVHVQSMVLATDNTGLEILLGAGALDCPANLQDAIQRYELASTAAILDAGCVVGLGCLGMFGCIHSYGRLAPCGSLDLIFRPIPIHTRAYARTATTSTAS